MKFTDFTTFREFTEKIMGFIVLQMFYQNHRNANSFFVSGAKFQIKSLPRSSKPSEGREERERYKGMVVAG